MDRGEAAGVLYRNFHDVGDRKLVVTFYTRAQLYSVRYRTHSAAKPVNTHDSNVEPELADFGKERCSDDIYLFA